MNHSWREIGCDMHTINKTANNTRKTTINKPQQQQQHSYIIYVYLDYIYQYNIVLT